MAFTIWRESARRHLEAVYPFTSDFRARRARREPHPIYDFIFTYYPYSTRKLEQWHPGLGVVLEASADPASTMLLKHSAYRRRGMLIEIDPAAISGKDVDRARQVAEICRVVLERGARFACYGLHEWAMVYRAQSIRHSLPLRFSPERIASFVEDQTVCCSHYDAFRFFTPAAVRLNVLQPTDDRRVDNEQGGCLHANMDLYKWAFKLSPFVSSDLLRDCFLLAIEARELDMQASPYDVSSLGFDPIEVETASGREKYKELQQRIAMRASTLRRRLQSEAENIILAGAE